MLLAAAAAAALFFAIDSHFRAAASAAAAAERHSCCVCVSFFFSYITLTLHARCTDHIPNVENSRTMMFLLYAASFVLRHHHFVLLDGIDRAVVCILGGARKAMS